MILDSRNNTIGLKTLVKVYSSPYEFFGEIRGIYKDYLFVWIKNRFLASNGYFCVSYKQVVNAGEELTKAQHNEKFKAFEVGTLDRR